MQQENTYGLARVKEPRHVLPTSAWSLDNSRRLNPGELRIDVRRIHVESTSFKEICLEAADSELRIRQKIQDIVIKRGKLHNPVTDTGGLLYGEVAEIDPAYPNTKNFRVGEEVICNASLTSIPLYIDKILSVDKAYGQLEVEGYCIVSGGIPVVRLPKKLPIKLLLFIFNESGTVFRIGNTAVGKKRILIVGNNLLSNLLFGYAARKVAREGCEIVCVLDNRTEAVLKGEGITRLTKTVFDRVLHVNILKPLESIDAICDGGLYDLTVNCANIQGAETVNILATKPGGTVIFANLINNYNVALYITEAISRPLDIRCADGYLEAYDDFDLELVRDIAPYIENAEETTLRTQGETDSRLSRRSRMMKAASLDQSVMEDFVCESHAMSVVLDEVMTVSKFDCNVFITGESGAGKGRIADVLHKNSSRKLQPFIKVNCTALAADEIEEEFFGVEGEKAGFLEQAENGTLYLNEIGSLGLDMQAKLLRVLQDGEFFRVKGKAPVKLAVRILSATNKNPEDLIEEGAFRRDLYYKLNVVRIRVPSLRARTADIPALVKHFLELYGARYQVERRINDDALEYLEQCEWPGNIRELENVVQRLMIASKKEELTLLDVMREMHADVFDTNVLNDQEDRAGEELNMTVMVDNFEKNIIRHAMEKYGSTRKAARAIGISQTQLVRKKNKYGIQ